MWAGPKKGDKIGDRIREEAGLDRGEVFRLGQGCIWSLWYMEGVLKHTTLRSFISTEGALSMTLIAFGATFVSA